MSMYPKSIVSWTLETKINLFSMKYAELPTLMSSAMQSSEVQCNVIQCSAVQCCLSLYRSMSPKAWCQSGLAASL